MAALTDEKIKAIVKRYRPKGWRVAQRRYDNRLLEGQANYDRKTLYVPRIEDFYTLHLFLHECAHVVLKHWTVILPKHREEFEAEKFAFDVLRTEGIRVPRGELKKSRAYVRRECQVDKQKFGASIEPHIWRWANQGRKKKERT